jgi:hypothetical protein
MIATNVAVTNNYLVCDPCVRGTKERMYDTKKGSSKNNYLGPGN